MKEPNNLNIIVIDLFLLGETIAFFAIHQATIFW